MFACDSDFMTSALPETCLPSDLSDPRPLRWDTRSLSSFPEWFHQFLNKGEATGCSKWAGDLNLHAGSIAPGTFTDKKGPKNASGKRVGYSAKGFRGVWYLPFFCLERLAPR